jgi:hypothetical protein
LVDENTYKLFFSIFTFLTKTFNISGHNGTHSKTVHKLIQGRLRRAPTGRMGKMSWVTTSAADVAIRELGMDDTQGEGGRRRPGHDE